MFGGVRGRIASKRIRKAEKNHFGRMLSQISKELYWNNESSEKGK